MLAELEECQSFKFKIQKELKIHSFSHQSAGWSTARHGAIAGCGNGKDWQNQHISWLAESQSQ